MRKNGFLKGTILGAAVTFAALSLLSCGLRESAAKNSSLKGDSGKKLELLDALIDEYYIGEVKEKGLTEGIYKGYIDGLGDPYSVYYDEEETEKFLESTAGEYSGIGAVMSQDKNSGVITILQVYKDSPAEKAGIKDNDILYKVAGEEVTGIDLSEVVQGIRGDKGTQVELTILRGENAEEISVTATRDTIEAQTVSFEMREEKIGYIQVTEFDTVTCAQYEEALSALESQGMEGLIVDLRNNPGGSLSTVCDMLDLMLPKGTVVYTKDKKGEKTEYSSDEEHRFQKPVIVLMNGYSASASEIFAGALQDFGAGKVVGTQSYGKGVVQQIFDLKDKTSVKLTIAEYFTPKGRNINGEGITPDVEVEYEPNPKDPKADNQLDKAAEVLRQEIG